MKRQKAGSVVNLSPIIGRAGAVTVTAHYAAAKAGVLGFDPSARAGGWPERWRPPTG